MSTSTDEICALQVAWEPVLSVFKAWLEENEALLCLALRPEPTIKVLIFLALLDAGEACTYARIQKIFLERKVITGHVPINTLRTSMYSLGKALARSHHPLVLESLRGQFSLVKRQAIPTNTHFPKDPVILLADPPAICAETIALALIQKTALPVEATYFLEWSARWWENYFSQEVVFDVPYETNAWDKLSIRDRLFKSQPNLISFIGLATGEGLAEISLLKKILQQDEALVVHYLAIDSSPRLLRDHVGLLKETFHQEISMGRLLCSGVLANIFSELYESVDRIRAAYVDQGLIQSKDDFLPPHSPLFVTYLGNCLGNNFPDQEPDLFFIIRSAFQHRPIEVLLSVSVMRTIQDEYTRDWDDFLMQTPKHLLETKKLLTSLQPKDNKDLPEFVFSEDPGDKRSYLSVSSEPYVAKHGIKGKIYRFYYKLKFDLMLAETLGKNLQPLREGTSILLYNIIKYEMQSLIQGIEMGTSFKIKYDDTYHIIIDTDHGKREIAAFCAYLE